MVFQGEVQAIPAPGQGKERVSLLTLDPQEQYILAIQAHHGPVENSVALEWYVLTRDQWITRPAVEQITTLYAWHG